MESFLRAHVRGLDISARKETKSDARAKKRLQQMLCGYKQGNNDLIINSENLINQDSSSVSDFSDLDITNTSTEGNIPQKAVSSDQCNPALGDIGESKTSDNLKIGTDDQTDSMSVDIDDYEVCQTEDRIQDGEDNLPVSVGCDSDDMLNSDLGQTSSDYETEQSGEFDPDGILAARILQSLGRKENLHKIKNSIKTKKRKFCAKDNSADVIYKGPYRPKDTEVSDSKETGESNSLQASHCREYRGPIRPLESDTEEYNDKKLSNKNIQLSKDKVVYKGPYRPEDTIGPIQTQHSKSDETVENVPSSMDEDSDYSIVDDDDYSPAYISITAIDMPSQSFDEILGEYKHPTIRNLPSDSQNFGCSSAGMFLSEELNIDNLEIKVGTDSLISEVKSIDTAENETALNSSIDINDGSFYDETLQSEHISDRELCLEPEASLINPIKIYYAKNTCILVVKHPAEIYIHGKVMVKCLGGTVEVSGYTLQDQACEIYAPNYNCAQYLRTVPNEIANCGLFGKLTSAGLTVPEAEEIVVTLGDYDAVVCLQPLVSPKLDFVENHFTVTDLFSKTNRNVDIGLKRASEHLGCSLYLTKPSKCFTENASWEQVIKCGLDSSQSRGLICGGKGTGKSTFLRYYTNKLLGTGPVLLIDLDPGQCEFTVAGNVSATVVSSPLLGPSFTHLKKPEIMLNVGMINTMDNPTRYANAVETLLTHCSTSEHLAKLPWVINTMGMCNAMGLKFMSLIILRAKPTFLLQIDSKNQKKCFETHLYPHAIKQLYFKGYQHDRLFRNISDVENTDYLLFVSHHTENTVKNNFSLAPKDERYLNFLAYFGELLNGKIGNLLEIVPYEVSMRGLGVGANVKISADSLMKVINGKVVALCERAGTSAPFALVDNAPRCRGHGLIRGIDYEKEMLYVITPTLPEELAFVNALVYADWVPELRGQEGHLPAGTAVPYRTASQYQQRQLLFAPKRRFNPLQLLKMTRNS